MIPELFLQITVGHVLYAPPSSRKRPVEAKTSRNSLSWTILQATPLFRRFYSATLSVTSTKQGFYAQSIGGVPDGPAGGLIL